MRSILRRVIMIVLLNFAVFICAVYAQDAEESPTFALAHELNDVSDFALSNDNSRLLIVDTNGNLFIWDISTGATVLQLNDTLSDATLNSVSWSSDDQLVAGAFSDGGRIWDTNTGEVIAMFDDYPIQPLPISQFVGMTGIVFSPDVTVFATYNTLDRTVLLYDTYDQTLIQQFGDHEDSYMLGLAFSPDSSLLVVRQLSSVTVWNIQSTHKRLEVFGEAMALSPDGSKIATGFGRFTSEVWIWDTDTGNLLSEFSVPLSLAQLEWTPDSQRLFARLTGRRLVHDDDDFIYVGEGIWSWSITDASVGQFYALEEIRNLLFEPNKEQTLLAIGVGHIEGDVLLWDRANEDIFRQSPSPETPSHDYSVAINPIYTFAVSSDSSVIVGGYNHGVAIWDIQSDELLDMIDIGKRVLKIELTATDNSIIGLTDDNQLKIWRSS